MRGKAALWLRRALGVGLLLGVWQLASLCFSPLVLPPVPQVAGTLAWLIREPDFWPTVGTTLLRLTLGLGIGLRWVSILGLLFGLCPKLEDVGRHSSMCSSLCRRYAGLCWLWYGLGLTAGLCIHRGRIHHSDGGDQPEPRRAGRRPGTSGDGEALPLFPPESPASCDAALYPPLFPLRVRDRRGRRLENWR